MLVVRKIRQVRVMFGVIVTKHHYLFRILIMKAVHVAGDSINPKFNQFTEVEPGIVGKV